MTGDAALGGYFTAAMDLYFTSVTLHVLAALLWLGGMFFLAVVGAPVLRDVEPSLRADLFRRLGTRFRTVSWWAIGVLLLTGVANLYLRGVLRWVFLGSRDFWTGRYGQVLAVKLACVVIMLVLSVLHDFVWGPAASRVEAGSPKAIKLRRLSSWVARINILLGLILVLAAVRLARGG